jgi:signal transduction histidine kinase
MTSLRTRLILGSSLVTVVPLAVAIYLLTERIEAMVRAQAVERLNAALGGMQAQVESDGQRIAEKLQILGRDPLLKRLYLLRPAGSRELTDYLAERQFLLGLDFLHVADTSGMVVADGFATASPMAGRHPRARAVGVGALRGRYVPLIEGLEDSSGLALAASAPIRYENRLAGVVHGGLILDAGFLARRSEASGADLVLRDAGGRAVATTLTEAPDPTPPDPRGVAPVELAGRSFLSLSVPLAVGEPPHASVTGLASTASADQTVAALQRASAILGLLGLGLAIILGAIWSSQISAPVKRLAAFSDKLAQGEWDEPLTLHSVRELETLVHALDRMRRDLQTYRDRLVTSERQAAWSQMAQKVAHEVKNPLTPIAISIADLKRSFDQKRTDFPEILDQAVKTVADEVETLRRLLQEFSDFARFPQPQLAPCRMSVFLADLETLYGREVAAGRLRFARPDQEIHFSADPDQMRRALVNLVKNGLEALHEEGRVTVSAGVEGAAVEIAVSDTGPGLSAEQRANLFVPGFTTKSDGSGLGLTIVERIVNDHHGTIAVGAQSGIGTTFRIRLPLERRS